MRLVIIEWIDPSSVATTGRWGAKADLDDITPAKCKSVGWVHKDDGENVIIYSHDAGDQVGGDFCIPHRCITSLRDIAGE